MMNKNILRQFILLTFAIAYFISTLLILFGQFGYTVHNWVDTFEQFIMNVPFALYILSPAIASYIVLKKNDSVSGIKEWLATVFYIKTHPFIYLYVLSGLVIYFMIHWIVSGQSTLALPFYTLFLSLPGNLIIGGLEEAGWMYILQPSLYKRYGFILSSLGVGIIWLFWHIPLFFIPGTNHGEGLIHFGMFAVQILAFRFFHGAIYRITGKGRVFMSVFFHTLFNAASPMFGKMTMTWPGTILANSTLILLSFITVALYDNKIKMR